MKTKKTHYFIMDRNTMIKNRAFFKEDKDRLLVPSPTPQLFPSYDAARSAIGRTETFCKKLRKLKLYPGLDQYNNPAVPSKSPRLTKERSKRREKELYRYRMHKKAQKGLFYAFSARSVSIISATEHEKATGRIVQSDEEIVSNSLYALKLTQLQHWSNDPGEYAVITRFLNKSKLNAVDKAWIDTIYNNYIFWNAASPNSEWVDSILKKEKEQMVLNKIESAIGKAAAQYDRPLPPYEEEKHNKSNPWLNFLKKVVQYRKQRAK